MEFMNFDPSTGWEIQSSLLEYKDRFPGESGNVSSFLSLLSIQPLCFYRDLFTPGHFTASAWVVSDCGKYALMAHHKKLDKWLQLGGHADGDANLLQESRREVEEEGGVLADIVLSIKDTPVIFDLDLHDIPPHKEEPAHLHFDCRFLFKISRENQIICSDESNDLRWIALSDMSKYTQEPSIVRMVEKTLVLDLF